MFTLFLMISLIIVMVFLGDPLGGARLYLPDIAHVLRHIVIDLCFTPYIPLGNGDADRTGVGAWFRDVHR
jgi:hypothetical protein